MKILSFDVGIKNLAYCILEHGFEGDDLPFKIHDWGVIDVTEIKENNNTDINLDFINNYKKMPIKDLKSEMEKNNIDTKGKKKELIERVEKFLKSKDLLKKKTTRIELIDHAKNLYNTLDEYSSFLDVSYVIIENQPVLKNPTMKSLQMLLYSYFVIRGIIDKRNEELIIKLISARNKLKVYEGPEIICECKSKYQQTKKLGIEYCKYFIKNDKEKLDYFNNHKKKDDLADSFLQGVYFFKYGIKTNKKKKKLNKENLIQNKLENYLT
tara:strand:+ start:83 stop:886 length:804 start_codon:yes stop_codon:yes gene_type:complete